MDLDRAYKALEEKTLAGEEDSFEENQGDSQENIDTSNQKQEPVEYAANAEKTEYNGLAQALNYAENEDKTMLEEKEQLVSEIHCHL